jgi:hypothetical protein
MKGSHDDRRALQSARKEAMARAQNEAVAQPSAGDIDLDEAECFVRLLIEMYGNSLGLSMGRMPDASAVWLRLRYPSAATCPHAGLVAFVVSDDSIGLLRKAVLALEASPESKWWKPDQFAAQQTK